MTPLPLVGEHDIRPSVSDLLTEHDAAVSKIRTLISVDELFDKARHDDLFLLRFWLSHAKKGGVERAAAAARATMRYRQQHGLDAADIRNEWPDMKHRWPVYDSMYAHIVPGSLSHCLPHADRGVISMVDMTGLDQGGMATRDAAEALRAHQRWTEWCFQMVDDITRRTGRLTKTCRLIDMAGMRLTAMDRKYLANDGANAKVTEDHYPQLLAAAFICHAPTWVQVMWRVFRPFFPARFVEKLDLISPLTNPAEARRILRYVAAADVPTRFGGELDAWPPPLGKENLR